MRIHPKLSRFLVTLAISPLFLSAMEETYSPETAQRVLNMTTLTPQDVNESSKDAGLNRVTEIVFNETGPCYFFKDIPREEYNRIIDFDIDVYIKLLQQPYIYVRQYTLDDFAKIAYENEGRFQKSSVMFYGKYMNVEVLEFRSGKKIFKANGTGTLNYVITANWELYKTQKSKAYPILESNRNISFDKQKEEKKNSLPITKISHSVEGTSYHFVNVPTSTYEEIMNLGVTWYLKNQQDTRIDIQLVNFMKFVSSAYPGSGSSTSSGGHFYDGKFYSNSTKIGGHFKGSGQCYIITGK